VNETTSYDAIVVGSGMTLLWHESSKKPLPVESL